VAANSTSPAQMTSRKLAGTSPPRWNMLLRYGTLLWTQQP